MPDRSLPRTERLRSLGAVRRLFESGESGFVYPFRYVWFAEPDLVQSVEVLFSVPKKFHKRANRRNLLRRRTKEAYRLQKNLLRADAPGQPRPGAHLLLEGGRLLQNHRPCRPPDSGIGCGASVSGYAPCR